MHLGRSRRPQERLSRSVQTAKPDPSASIDYHLIPNVSHAPETYAGLQIYLDSITARFSGQPVEPGFTKYDPKPIQPAAAQQLESN